MSVKINKISKHYGEHHLFEDLNFDVQQHEIVALVGPSGCGKSTLLRIIAGFEKPTAGEIICSGNTKTIFQYDGLLPWMTVKENIALGAKQNPQDIAHWLERVQMLSFVDHYPRELSGGMRQRAELARAMIGGSDVLLMDEPFSALDMFSRLKLREELAIILNQEARTVILVTHDVVEAAQLADRIFILSNRPMRIIQELKLNSKRPRLMTAPEVIAVAAELIKVMEAGQ